MKLGARILKTGIAIVISLYIAQLLDLPSPVFAPIAAIFAVQPTIYRSYLSIIEQIQGNIIGAVIAVIFVMIFGNGAIFVGLAAIIVITINLKLKIENNIGLSLVTLIAIMETQNAEFIQFAVVRFSTIMLGVLAAFIVNLVFLPPKYENKLYFRISSITEEITRWIRFSSRHASEHKLLKNDIDRIKESNIKLEQLYLMYKEERNYFKRNNLVKSRKLVIYRQMISTMKRSLETLKLLHRFENNLLIMSESFQETLQHQLDTLTHHHEQLLLRFIGKIRTQPIEENQEYINKVELYDMFVSQQKNLDENDPVLYHIMQIISSIIEYGEYVEHLDTLINSFQSFHKKENEVTIEEEVE